MHNGKSLSELCQEPNTAYILDALDDGFRPERKHLMKKRLIRIDATPQQHAILWQLMCRRFVTREAISPVLWPAREPDTDCIPALITGLRKRLAPLGWSIRHVQRKGWILDRANASVPDDTNQEQK